ncbi:hypothetical protein E8E14_012234 [Neopestalotiopsis sp. 37M]|nr:hypothetical protein E8E14_012234 [Neopestalotiopsis sp. 37M]
MLLLDCTTIRLDVTIADLYRQEGLSNLIYIPHYPSSHTDYGPSHPRNRKFHINDVLRGNMPPGLSKSERQAYAVKYTISVMSRFKFFLGNMDVLRICSRDCPPVLLNGNGTLPIPNSVDPAQLPQHIIDVFVDDEEVNLIHVLRGLGRTIVVPFPHDWCASLPHAVDPDRHYLFHSKAYLSRLPVNVPRQEIFSLDDQLLCDLRVQPAPFVVKSTHGQYNTGTWVVTSEAERREMLDALDKLRKPVDGSVPWAQDMLVTEFIDATHNYCVHFFVGRTGRSAFMGVTEQCLDRGGRWRGTIQYERQDALKVLFDDITASLAEGLAADGYIGPAGADILIDRAGKQWLIDLNPRINGGTPLCLMNQHLSVKRHLHHATLIVAVQFVGSPAKFSAAIESQLHQGYIIILSLTTSQDAITGKDRHTCMVICAGKTADHLEAVIGELYDNCDRSLVI